jgi:hypothetical protein
LPRHSTVLPRKRITDSFSEEGAGFSVSGFGIDLVCSGLKSERDTPFPRFVPSAGPVDRRPDRAKPEQTAGPVQNLSESIILS